MLKRNIIIGVALSIVTIVGCSNETSKVQEQVEVKMTEVLEDSKEIVAEAEPLTESEEDVINRMEMQAELKSSIANITGFEEETINLMLSLHSEPSCSIVLRTESTIENAVIEEIKKNIVQILSKQNVTISEESIVITSNKTQFENPFILSYELTGSNGNQFEKFTTTLDKPYFKVSIQNQSSNKYNVTITKDSPTGSVLKSYEILSERQDTFYSHSDDPGIHYMNVTSSGGYPLQGSITITVSDTDLEFE